VGLDKLVLIGFLSANLLAPATGYGNSLEDPHPNRTRKYLHQGPVEEEYCGGPDNPCVFGEEDLENKSDEIYSPVPVHDLKVVKNQDDSVTLQLIDFTKPEKEEVVIKNNKKYHPQAHVESYEAPRKNIVPETKKENQESNSSMEQLTPGVKKSTYFVKGAFHLKKSVTSCVNPTGNEEQDLASAIIEAEKLFKEEFGINVKYISNGEHAYDAGKRITKLNINMGKHKEQYCAEIVAGINPLKK